MNKEQKAHWIAVMQDHQNADRLRQGSWYKKVEGGFTGCFFGCAMQTDKNVLESAAEAMGLPLWLVTSAEAIFEGLPQEEALVFPVQLLLAIPPDTDLRHLKHEIAIERLTKLAEANVSVAEVINNVIKCHRQALESTVESTVWATAARSAAESAESAESTWSARSARSAAWSTAESARSAAWSTAWSTEAKTLLTILYKS